MNTIKWHRAIYMAIALVSPSMSFAQKAELWVYTSVYKDFAAPIEAAFEAKHPDIDVKVFQGGSEKIQAKVEAELLANKTQADIILTSDPFWGHMLNTRGLAYQPPGRKPVETNYYSAMVLICHQSFPIKDRPASYKDLLKPAFKSLIQTGNPLESGTAFTMVAHLSGKYGWSYFDGLAKNRLASNGGNATVIQKVESGEKKIGIVLLENALAAKKRGSPIEIIYPSDGAVMIPSVQVIMKTSPQKEAAVKFADFIVSLEGQKLLRNGFMYSVRNDVSPPDGGVSLSELLKTSKHLEPEAIGKVAGSQKEIKQKFSELVLE